MAFFIDYNCNFDHLYQQIYKLSSDLNTYNDNMLCDLYSFVIYTRHNILHYFILDCLNQPWKEEEPLSKYYDLDAEMGRKTPDIIVQTKEKDYLIDVSISYDVAKNLNLKKSKYQPIIEYLNKTYTYKSFYFLHVNVLSDSSNIEQEVERLKKYGLQKKQFEYSYHNRLNELIKDIITDINRYVDKGIFAEYKTKTFSKININNEELTTKDILFLDELRQVNIGIRKDLNYDTVVVENYNSRYDHMSNFDQHIEIFNEDSFLEQLKVDIEGKGSLYQKYKDLTLTEDQFENANKEITSKNKQLLNRKPKPTHHLLLPFGDDQIYTQTQPNLNEQKSIIIFMTEFVKNFKNIEMNQDFKNDLPNKFYLINDLCKEVLWCLNDSPDAVEQKNWYFDHNKAEYKEYKKEFKLLKTKQKFIKVYDYRKKLNKKFKMTTKILTDLNITTFTKDSEENILELYNEYKNDADVLNLSKNPSFRSYLRSKNIIQEDETKTYLNGKKFFKINFQNLHPESRTAYEKTGINYDVEKQNYLLDKENQRVVHDENKIDITDIRETIDMDNYRHVDKFIKFMTKNTITSHKYKEEDFLLSEPLGQDSEQSNEIKMQSINNYKDFYNILKSTNMYNYSRLSSQLYKQLFHHMQINSKPKNFCFFNNGIDNYMVIMASTFNKYFNDNGKPFLSIIKTKTPDLYDELYGKIYKVKIPNTEYTYVLTNWRRLTLQKVNYLKDVFYQTLSSTMNSVMSSPVPYMYFISDKLQSNYVIRCLIGYSTNQKICELLMDMRYAYMSAFSVYTNINKLIVEKFGPPYYTCMETWIVNRLLTRLLVIHKKAITDGIMQNQIQMINYKRDINTIGGQILLPSLWFDYNLTDVTELLDEAFIYVHTMKDPSNIHHENIKAIRTINKFQQEFDKLPVMIKKGELSSYNDIKNYLLYPTQIGFCAPIIYKSTKLLYEKEKPDFGAIVDNIADESVGEILSTKAVIHDLDREIVKKDKTTKKEFKKKKKKIQLMLGSEMNKKERNMMDNFVIKTHNQFYGENKPRQKVMETILTKLIRNRGMISVVDMAFDFIKNEDAKVLADICIKSQYGAKREFYVVNLGAKALARVTENFFKKMCENSTHEAISIPGDEKIIKMQKMLDNVYYNKLTKNHKLMYVNGDCTKWSAAETMGSFLSMIYSFKEVIPNNLYQLLVATFNAWSDKEIQVPLDIFNKVIPLTAKTEYLGKNTITKNARLKSTQNFLQGMFNYSSSYKAVACINYTIHCWYKMYPESRIIVEHMEHSDDYVLLVLYENFDEFEKFRVFQKIMMRLHGYNDSDRKTSCQPFFMEFVSQISFNGVMLYPQIKKSKEVNLSLPCIGYTTDMEAVLSRVKECARVGCNQSYLYFFQRLHIYLLAEAYAILPNMKNNMNRNLKQLYNMPIELFGLPDCLPLFSVYCRGNCNNYRLYMYGDEYSRRLLFYLYRLAIVNSEKEKILYENIDYKYSLQTPKFLYELHNRTIRNLQQKLNLSEEEMEKFWSEHISYKLIKPKTTEDLIIWIKCMFFNKTFLEAYSTSNRAAVTMRLSSFVSNKIIKPYVTFNDYQQKDYNLIKSSRTMIEYYSDILTDYQNYLNNQFYFDEKDILFQRMLMKIITKCDPTFSAIYSIINKMKILGLKSEKDRTIQIANYTPYKLKTTIIINNPSTLIQYMFNRNDFEKDKRTFISKESFDKDIETIRQRTPSFMLENKTTMNILALFNDLMINKETRIVTIGYQRETNLLFDAIEDVITHNFQPGYIIKLQLTDVITIIDPNTGEIMYTKGEIFTKDYNKQNIENITLYYIFFCHYYNMTLMDFRKLLDNITFYEGSRSDGIKQNYKTILEKVNIATIQNYMFNLTETKIIAFIKAILLNQYDLLDDIVNNTYTYAYHYIRRDYPIGGIYKGTTEVDFTYMSNTCKAYYNPKQHKKPCLMVHKYFKSITPTLYNVSLRLIGSINDKQFERNINKNNIATLTWEEHKNLSGFYEEYNIKYIVEDSEEPKIRKIKTLNEYDFQNSKIIPVYLTDKPIRRGGEYKIRTKPLRVVINSFDLSVKYGKSKLYTLPFWRCKQYPGPEISIKQYIDNIPIQYMLDNSRIEKFIKRKLNQTNDFYQLNLDDEYYQEIMKDNIKNFKIYNFNYNNLIKIENELDNNNLKELDKDLEDMLAHKSIEKRIIKFNYNDPAENYFVTIYDEKTQMEELININIPDTNIENNNNTVEQVNNLQDNKTNLNNNNFGFEFDDFLQNAEANFDDDFMEDNYDYTDQADLTDILEDDYIISDPIKNYGFEITMNDQFLVMPKKERNSNKIYATHMLEMLKKEEPLLIKIIHFNYDNDGQFNDISMGELIEKLNFYIDLYNMCEKDSKGGKNDEKLFCLYNIYNLLCRCHIYNDYRFSSTKSFVIEKDEIIFCQGKNYKFDFQKADEVSNRIRQSKIIKQIIQKDKNDNFLEVTLQPNKILWDIRCTTLIIMSEINLDQYIKIYNLDLKKGTEKHRFILKNTQAHKQSQIVKKLNSRQEDITQFLDNLLE